MLKVISWNVNSVRARVDSVEHVLKAHQPDFLALQETKVTDDLFPFDQFPGYTCHISGQPSYNGVAWVCKNTCDVVCRDLPGFEEQKRFIAIEYNGWTLINVYVPNGGDAIGGDKYTYKLKWLEAFCHQISTYDTSKMLICGDFNIAPTDQDVYDPLKWNNCVLVSDEERAYWQKIKDIGLSDVFRTKHQDQPGFTWWDYRGFAYRRKHGLRIDHFLISNNMIDKVEGIIVDEETRRLDRPSDHAPVQVSLKL
jgi:exodeoxyribonuclease-3